MNKTVTKPTHEDAIPLPMSGKAAALATGGMNFIDGAMRLSGSYDTNLGIARRERRSGWHLVGFPEGDTAGA